MHLWTLRNEGTAGLRLPVQHSVMPKNGVGVEFLRGRRRRAVDYGTDQERTAFWLEAKGWQIWVENTPRWFGLELVEGGVFFQGPLRRLSVKCQWWPFRLQTEGRKVALGRERVIWTNLHRWRIVIPESCRMIPRIWDKTLHRCSWCPMLFFGIEVN